MPIPPSQQTNRAGGRKDTGRANRVALEVPVVVTVDLLTEALAEVRWCRPFVELDDQPAGVGLRFIDTPLRAAFVVGALRRSRPVATAAPGRR